MSPEELLALVRTGEDSHTEFKTEDVHCKAGAC